MSIDTYQDLINSLGIDRGRLARGFDDYRTAPEPQREAPEVAPPCPPVPPHLQSKGRPQTEADHRAKLRQCSPVYRALYEAMLDRGLTVNRIAELVGVNRTCVHKALHGKASAKVYDAVLCHLNDTERGLVSRALQRSGTGARRASVAFNAMQR